MDRCVACGVLSVLVFCSCCRFSFGGCLGFLGLVGKGALYSVGLGYEIRCLLGWLLHWLAAVVGRWF